MSDCQPPKGSQRVIQAMAVSRKTLSVRIGKILWLDQPASDEVWADKGQAANEWSDVASGDNDWVGVSGASQTWTNVSDTVTLWEAA